MSSLPEAIVLVREDVLYFDESRIHLATNREHGITPQDEAVLEVLYRGESDFGLLCSRLATLSPGLDANAIGASLAESLATGQSILEVSALPELSKPDVVVCDFGRGSGWIDSPQLVRTLRRRHKVLFLGHDERVRGPLSQNLSPGAVEKNRLHGSWFQFAQWCRGVVRRSHDALLVLCSQQDAILFGDLVPNVRTLVALDPTWPARTGAEDLIGPGWLPDDPFDATRALFFALRFSAPKDLDRIRRGSSSDLAILEAYALKHAERVAHAALDQPAALVGLGVDRASMHLAHSFPTSLPARRNARSQRRTLVLVTGGDGGVEALLPYVGLLLSIPPERRPFGDIALVIGSTWFGAVSDAEGGQVVPLHGPPPDVKTTLAAILFPGLIRDTQAAFRALAGGWPCFLVPSAKPHPIQDGAPPEMVLQRSNPDTIVASLEELRDPETGLAERLLASQRRMLRERSITRLASEMVERRDGVPRVGEARG